MASKFDKKRFWEKLLPLLFVSVLMGVAMVVGSILTSYVFITRINPAVYCAVYDNLTAGYDVSEFSEKDFRDLGIDIYGTYPSWLERQHHTYSGCPSWEEQTIKKIDEDNCNYISTHLDGGLYCRIKDCHGEYCRMTSIEYG